MLRNDLYRPWFTEPNKAGEEEWGFEILSGDFSGIVVQIKGVSVSEQTEGEVALDFHVINKPSDMEESPTEDPAFTHVIELIINDILREAIDNYEQSGNNDTKESST